MIGLFVSLLVQGTVLAIQLTIALIRVLVVLTLMLARAVGNGIESAARKRRRRQIGLLPRRRPLPPDVRWTVFARDGYACVSCGSRVDLTADHVHAVSLDGTNVPSNLRTLCRACNCSKGTRLAA